MALDSTRPVPKMPSFLCLDPQNRVCRDAAAEHELAAQAHRICCAGGKKTQVVLANGYDFDREVEFVCRVATLLTVALKLFEDVVRTGACA